MAVYYLDTSALVKRYAVETGTTWVLSVVAQTAGNEIVTLRITGPEVIAALFRKVRTGEVPRTVIARLAHEFRDDWRDQYQILEVTTATTDRAMDLAERHGLRGYDAVHLASAIEVQRLREASALTSVTVVSADEQQLRAATAEGLLVENPNKYR